MRARYRTVAIQAIGVAIVAAFIWLAFLRPSEPDELVGIDAGEPPRTQTDPSPSDRNGQRRERKGPSDGDGDGGARNGRGSPPAAGTPGAGEASGGGALVAPAGDRDDTPTTSQYGDTAIRLLVRVGLEERPADILQPGRARPGEERRPQRARGRR